MTTQAESGKIAELERKIDSLSHQLGILQDIHDIRSLQYKYGYYIDKCLYDETVDLFSETGEVIFMGGRFKGKAGARRLYCDRFRARFTGGRNGPIPGFLLDHPLMQAIIDVEPDRKTAYARLRVLMQAGVHESLHKKRQAEGENAQAVPRQWFEGGLYENTYVKEDGVWKIKILNYRPQWHAEYEKGWSYTKPNYVPFFDKTYPEDPIGPDELVPESMHLWPDMPVLPFHYPHPVTGRYWKER